MATNKDINDETQYGARIKLLEANLVEVDAARVALEERVEKLEAWIAAAPQQTSALGTDSMGLPKVV